MKTRLSCFLCAVVAAMALAVLAVVEVNGQVIIDPKTLDPNYRPPLHSDPVSQAASDAQGVGSLIKGIAKGDNIIKYGNWYGPKWWGGNYNTPTPGGKPPVDALDAAAMRHDFGYQVAEKYGKIYGKAEEYRLKAIADYIAVRDVMRLDPDPSKWNPPAADPEKASRYRDRIITGFDYEAAGYDKAGEIGKIGGWVTSPIESWELDTGNKIDLADMEKQVTTYQNNWFKNHPPSADKTEEDTDTADKPGKDDGKPGEDKDVTTIAKGPDEGETKTGQGQENTKGDESKGETMSDKPGDSGKDGTESQTEGKTDTAKPEDSKKPDTGMTSTEGGQTGSGQKDATGNTAEGGKTAGGQKDTIGSTTEGGTTGSGQSNTTGQEGTGMTSGGGKESDSGEPKNDAGQKVNAGNYQSGDTIVTHDGTEYVNKDGEWQKTGNNYGPYDPGKEGGKSGGEGGGLKGNEATAGEMPDSDSKPDSAGGAGITGFSEGKSSKSSANTQSSLEIIKTQSTLGQASTAGDQQIKDANNIKDKAGSDSQKIKNDGASQIAGADSKDSWSSTLAPEITQGLAAGIWGSDWYCCRWQSHG